MQNVVIIMCEFHYDWLRNDRALADQTSDNNKKNVCRNVLQAR